jgi:hypothetical protein
MATDMHTQEQQTYSQGLQAKLGSTEKQFLTVVNDKLCLSSFLIARKLL